MSKSKLKNGNYSIVEMLMHFTRIRSGCKCPKKCLTGNLALAKHRMACHRPALRLISLFQFVALTL
jgi:hypothetical protein